MRITQARDPKPAQLTVQGPSMAAPTPFAELLGASLGARSAATTNGPELDMRAVATPWTPPLAPTSDGAEAFRFDGLGAGRFERSSVPALSADSLIPAPPPLEPRAEPPLASNSPPARDRIGDPAQAPVVRREPQAARPAVDDHTPAPAELTLQRPEPLERAARDLPASAARSAKPAPSSVDGSLEEQITSPIPSKSPGGRVLVAGAHLPSHVDFKASAATTSPRISKSGPLVAASPATLQSEASPRSVTVEVPVSEVVPSPPIPATVPTAALASGLMLRVAADSAGRASTPPQRSSLVALIRDAAAEESPGVATAADKGDGVEIAIGAPALSEDQRVRLVAAVGELARDLGVEVEDLMINGRSEAPPTAQIARGGRLGHVRG